MQSLQSFRSSAVIPMHGLSPGERGTVKAITLTGSMRRRLQDVGLIPGTPVECVGKSPLGDPSAYLIRGAVIALRASDCRGILLGKDTLWD
ncbi:MAG: ferrous iron transport protein A [Clostridia bacterium]|nr:ferrous iron transport protein A [Clostridia bacterium]